ncbi:hypothetical protein ACP4OV_010671 [Aristida adscensionis]
MMKKVALDVESTDTVDQIKSIIGAIEGIEKSQQELFFTGIHLESNNTLADYNIIANSSVDLYAADGMQISAKIPSVGKTIKLNNLKKSQSVADIKAAIEKKRGIPLNEQILMCSGQLLEENHMLSQCGISNGQQLHVLVRPTDNLRVSVYVGGDRTINLDVRCWYTVADVKFMIETLEGLSAWTQILRCTQSAGVVAPKDSETLQSQHVKNKDILTLHLHSTLLQFFIKTWEGKTLSMLMDISDTIEEVMKKLEEKLKVKPGRSTLRAPCSVAWGYSSGV